jgi:hypothetical protein
MTPAPQPILAVTFWDHTEDAQEPMLCTAYGRLVRENEQSLTLNAWVGSDDHPHNNKFYTLLKATVVQRVSLVAEPFVPADYCAPPS